MLLQAKEPVLREVTLGRKNLIQPQMDADERRWNPAKTTEAPWKLRLQTVGPGGAWRGLAGINSVGARVKERFTSGNRQMAREQPRPAGHVVWNDSPMFGYVRLCSPDRKIRLTPAAAQFFCQTNPILHNCMRHSNLQRFKCTSVRDCFETMRGAAARAPASPRRAVTTGPAPHPLRPPMSRPSRYREADPPSLPAPLLEGASPDGVNISHGRNAVPEPILNNMQEYKRLQ